MDREAFFQGVYDILVQRAGASDRPDPKAQFVYSLTHDRHVTEYRFGGVLGFGGKFRPNRGAPYVDYYPEDRTPEGDAAVASTNEALTAYVKEHGYPV